MSAPECGVCTRPVGDGLRLCTECGTTLITHLREIPGLLAELDTARSGQARFAGERVGGKSAEVPLPIVDVTRRSEQGVRLLGERERHRVINVVTTWARDIGETREVRVRAATPPPFHPDYWAALADVTVPGDIPGLVDWLTRHVHELRGHVAAEELHSDILGAVIGLRRVIDRPIDRKFVGTCPQDGTNLLAEVGESWVRCRTCREQYSVRELLDRAIEAVEDMLCTIPELLRACEAVKRPVGKTTAYRWARDGLLTRRGWLTHTEQGDRITDHETAGATPVYRVGDALELSQTGRKTAV